MQRALAGSLVAHVVAFAVIGHAIVRRTSAPRRDELAVEIVEVESTVESPVAVVAPRARLELGKPIDPGGGGSAPGARTAREPRRTGVRARSEVVHEHGPSLGGLADLIIEDRSEGRGDGRGDGRGIGNAYGDGIGTGLGTALRDGRGVAIPPPPAASRARPARLIYPARHRDVDGDDVFVARVTVDDSGYVVGARIVHGQGGHHDDRAADLIFRFRYAPALDDAGHPIASTFEQPFLVQ